METDLLLGRLNQIAAQQAALEAENKALRAELETQFASGHLEADGWLDGGDRIPCDGFSLSRQVRRKFTYSDALQAAEADLKARRKTEEQDGSAKATESFSWVLRQEKGE